MKTKTKKEQDITENNVEERLANRIKNIAKRNKIEICSICMCVDKKPELICDDCLKNAIEGAVKYREKEILEIIENLPLTRKEKVAIAEYGQLTISKTNYIIDLISRRYIDFIKEVKNK